MATHSLVWREVSPGQYERDIDEAEQFYTSMAKTWEGTGHTYFAITACTGLSVPRSTNLEGSDLDAHVEQALQYAWKKIRYDHPTLAAPVEFDAFTKRCRKVYHSLAENEIEAWMDETFKLVDTGQTGEDFANSDPPVGRYATLYLITLPDHTNANEPHLRRDLVFRSPHDLIDGIGTLTLINNLLGHMTTCFEASTPLQVIFGDEQKNLSPPLRIAAGIPLSPSAEQKTKLAAIQCSNASARANHTVLSIPLSSILTHPRNSQRVAIHLTVSETSALLAKAKFLSTTPTQIFHTGIALALRNLQPQTTAPEFTRYISYSLINLRHCCIPPYHKPRHAASVYHCVSAGHLGVDLTIPTAGQESEIQSPSEFLEALDQVHTFYQTAKIDADYLSIAPSLFSSVTPTYPCLSSPPIPEPNLTPSISLSSLGILDKIIQPRHGEFTVMEPWVMGAEYSTGIGAFLGTWGGRMGVSAGYNEAFYGRGQVVRLLGDVRRIVLEGMGVLEETGVGLLSRA